MAPAMHMLNCNCMHIYVHAEIRRLINSPIQYSERGEMEKSHLLSSTIRITRTVGTRHGRTPRRGALIGR